MRLCDTAAWVSRLWGLRYQPPKAEAHGQTLERSAETSAARGSVGCDGLHPTQPLRTARVDQEQISHSASPDGQVVGCVTTWLVHGATPEPH